MPLSYEERLKTLMYISAFLSLTLSAILTLMTGSFILTRWPEWLSSWVSSSVKTNIADILLIILSLVLSSSIIVYGIWRKSLSNKWFTLKMSMLNFRNRALCISFWVFIFYVLTISSSLGYKIFNYFSLNYMYDLIKHIVDVNVFYYTFIDLIIIGTIDGIPLTIEEVAAMLDWLRWRIIPEEIKSFIIYTSKVVNFEIPHILQELGYDYIERTRVEEEARTKNVSVESLYPIREERDLPVVERNGIRLKVSKREVYLVKLSEPRRYTIAWKLDTIAWKLDKIMEKLGI